MKDYRAIIKNKRETLKLSQHQLAKQLGITQTFLSEIERGRKNPSLEQFFKICEALDIKVFPEE
ncbi:MAG: helix-turn-helix transcriptional regulator [Oscillospiraceae bacterium]|nr:helix-turn-helix transcriptional regulator [Oscillospiraceae bacterium]